MAVYNRVLNRSHLDELCNLMERFAYEVESVAAYNVNRDRLYQVFEQYCSGGASTGFLVYDDGRLVGALMARLTTPAYSFEILAQEDFFYIDPEYRGRFLFVRLMNAFLSWAEAAGAKAAMMRVESGITLDRTSKLLELFGFTESGRSFMRAL